MAHVIYPNNLITLSVRASSGCLGAKRLMRENLGKGIESMGNEEGSKKTTAFFFLMKVQAVAYKY